jgi:hypothetical protein
MVALRFHWRISAVSAGFAPAHPKNENAFVINPSVKVLTVKPFHQADSVCSDPRNTLDIDQRLFHSGTSLSIFSGRRVDRCKSSFGHGPQMKAPRITGVTAINASNGLTYARHRVAAIRQQISTHLVSDI